MRCGAVWEKAEEVLKHVVEGSSALDRDFVRRCWQPVVSCVDTGTKVVAAGGRVLSPIDRKDLLLMLLKLAPGGGSIKDDRARQRESQRLRRYIGTLDLLFETTSSSSTTTTSSSSSGTITATATVGTTTTGSASQNEQQQQQHAAHGRLIDEQDVQSCLEEIVCKKSPVELPLPPLFGRLLVLAVLNMPTLHSFIVEAVIMKLTRSEVYVSDPRTWTGICKCLRGLWPEGKKHLLPLVATELPKEQFVEVWTKLRGTGAREDLQAYVVGTSMEDLPPYVRTLVEADGGGTGSTSASTAGIQRPP